jgi:predicted PurR-regulated permease PerM
MSVHTPVKRNDKPASEKIAQEVRLNVSNRTLIRIFAVTFGFLLAVAVLRQAASAIVLIFTAFFLALALNAPVQWVARHIPGSRRGNRSLATLLSVIFVLALLVGFLASIVPPFARQIGSLVGAAPSFVNDLHDSNSDIGKLIAHYNLEGQVDSFTDDLSNRLDDIAGSAASVVTSVGSSAFALLTVLALTFMMLVEGPHWVTLGEQLVPARRREHVRDLTRAMYRVVKGYVNGQVVLAAIAAFFIAPALFILGISYPVALVVIVFICGLIPMIGHFIGATIVTLVALATSPVAAIIVLAYYILYQQIENYFVQPKIQANTTNMSPLLVFIAVVVGVKFGGLLGGLVAIPVMGCIRIIVLDQLAIRNILDSKPTAELKADLAFAERKAD